MSEFHDDYPQYEFMAHHSEEEGKVKRKKLWRVFWIMLGITLIELAIGFKAKGLGLLDSSLHSTTLLMLIFIGFTVLKAGYIVLSFMHLGDEKPALKWAILAPYCAFIVYLAVMVSIGEGSYSGDNGRKNKMDQLLIDQQAKVRSGEGHHASEAGESEEDKKEETSHE